MTIGVMSRVEDLATVKEDEVSVIDWYLGNSGVKGVKMKDDSRSPYVLSVPLQEIIAEAVDVGVNSKRVQGEYEKLIKAIGNEFKVLFFARENELKGATSSKIVEGIMKLRDRDLHIDPGYDGVFGVVKIWGEGEPENSFQEQITLF